MSNHWIDTTSLHLAYPNKDIRTTPDVNLDWLRMPREFKEQLEGMVQEWLQRDDDSPILSIPIEADSYLVATVQFSKFETYVKTCSNCWEQWWIAHSSQWPRLISRKGKNLVMNDYDDSVVAKNELRGENYAPKH